MFSEEFLQFTLGVRTHSVRGLTPFRFQEEFPVVRGENANSSCGSGAVRT